MDWSHLTQEFYNMLLRGGEDTGRRGRRRKQLLDELKERRRYWEVKKKAPYRSSLGLSLWTCCIKIDYVMMKMNLPVG
jgi:hypothetical protein